MKLAYLPLEPYRERYTEMLCDWTTARWRDRCEVLAIYAGDKFDGDIETGVVLDAHRRCHWALTQMAALIKDLKEGVKYDAIYIDDLFHPGFESLPYIFAQQKERAPKLFTRNWAQSVDEDDFTFPMRRWMRHYERLVDQVTAGIFCASTCHAQAMRIAGLKGAQVVGLPFDSEDVRSRRRGAIARSDKPRVIFSSRWDKEKQPDFFMRVVRECGEQFEFLVCTGATELRSNWSSLIDDARDLEQDGLLRIRTGCRKLDYYSELAGASVQFNCALQDYVAFTTLEASAFGVPTLAPAYKSFPEVLHNDERRLFVPWSITDAVSKLKVLATTDVLNEWEIAAPSVEHDKTLDKMLGWMKTIC